MREGILDVVHEVADWVTRLFTANIFWLLMNIPILFIFFNMLFVPIQIGIFYYIASLVVFTPVLFFPSTIALFSTTRDWVLKRAQQGVIRAFFHYFKVNYVKSLKSGFLFTIIWLIWYGDYYYFHSIDNNMLVMVAIIVGIGFLIYTLQFIILLTHLDEKIWDLLRDAFYITFGRPIASVIILISFAVVTYLSLTKLWFLLPFFGGSVIAFLSFFFFYKFSLTK